MGELRHGIFPSESAIKEHVEGSGRQPFFATNHVRHLHQMVVNDIGQMVGWEVVSRLIEHLVVEDIGVDDNLTSDEVVNVHVFIGLNLKANDIFVASCDACIHLFFAECEGVNHLRAGAGIVLEIADFITLGFEFFGGVKSNVSMSAIEELIYILMVDFSALRLTIRPVRTCLHGQSFFGLLPLACRAFCGLATDTFVDTNAEPLEGFDDIFLSSRHESGRVRIFDAEEHVASMLTSEEIIIEGGTNTANVKSSGRGGCKTHAYFSFHI